MVDDLIRMGAPQDVIDKVREQARQADYEVWPENMAVLGVFLALSTSWDWITPGMGAPVRAGIRATEIEATARMMGIRGKQLPKVFRDIRAMEQAALNVWAEQR